MPKTQKQKALKKLITYRADQQPIVNEIDNFSKFVQIALDQYAGIMAWHLMKIQEPKKYKDMPVDSAIVKDYNLANPQNKLTKQRMSSLGNSPKSPELW